jgi:hypothetical protein
MSQGVNGIELELAEIMTARQFAVNSHK